MQTGEQFVIPYTLLDMAEDIIRLLDLLSIDKAHIIGTLNGGDDCTVGCCELPATYTIPLPNYVFIREPRPATKRTRCNANADEPKPQP